MSKLEAMFEEHRKREFIYFERIKVPRHPRPDLCAFLMLHELLGGDETLIYRAENDEIFLRVDTDLLAMRADSDFIRDLVRCGVRYNESTNTISMFV